MSNRDINSESIVIHDDISVRLYKMSKCVVARTHGFYRKSSHNSKYQDIRLEANKPFSPLAQ